MKRALFTLLACVLTVGCLAQQKAKTFKNGIKVLGTTEINTVPVTSRLMVLDNTGFSTTITLSDLVTQIGASNFTGIVAEGQQGFSNSGDEVVNHGLGYSPDPTRIQLQIINSADLPDAPSVKNINSTSFTIHNPNSSPATVAWRIFGTGGGSGGGGLENVAEDLTPQLGGDLDLNGFDITSPFGIELFLDSDNNGANTFFIRNGLGNSVMTVNENGDLAIIGPQTFTPTDTEPTAVKGRLYFDDSEGTLKQYNGTEWEALNGGGSDGNDFVDGLDLTGTTLTANVPNQTNPTVDLSPLQDGTGTDDQTAPEVPYSYVGASASDVAEALNDLFGNNTTTISNNANNTIVYYNAVTASYRRMQIPDLFAQYGGGGNLDAIYLANLGKAYFKKLSDTYSMVADDFRQTTGTHRGKYTELYHEGASDIEITATSAIPDSSSVSLYNKENGSIKILADAGLLWKYHANENPVLGDSTRALVTRHADSLYIDGAVTWEANAPPDFFPQDNAASVADVNSIGAGTETNPGIATVETTIVHDGSYSIDIETLGSAPNRRFITCTGLTAGVSTTVTFWGYEGNANAFASAWVRSADIQGNPGDVSTTIDGAAWAEYTLVFTPANTSFTLEIGNGGSSLNLHSYWDLITVTQ